MSNQFSAVPPGPGGYFLLPSDQCFLKALDLKLLTSQCERDKNGVMKWEEIRTHYPQQWLLVEAIEAHSEGDRRITDQLAVVDTFEDSRTALHRYAKLHHDEPERELYVLHTSREKLEIIERRWLGIWGAQ